MIEHRGYRYRIYPDRDQESLFRKTIGCCRFVYNLCLEQESTFGRRGRWISAFDQGAELKALKAEAPWLKEVPHHALVQAIADLHKAYTNFFEGRAGYPNRKRKSHSRGSGRDALRLVGAPERMPPWAGPEHEKPLA
jgi:transposase